jgi:hypothetical protein
LEERNCIHNWLCPAESPYFKVVGWWDDYEKLLEDFEETMWEIKTQIELEQRAHKESKPPALLEFRASRKCRLKAEGDLLNDKLKSLLEKTSSSTHQARRYGMHVF